MARLPYLEKTDLAPEDQDLLESDIGVIKLLAHSPGGARHFTQLGFWIRNDSKLDGRLRELAILQVGYLTKTEYEYVHHIEVGRQFGVTDEDLRALADGTDGRATGLDELAQLVLQAAREMTVDLRLSAPLFQRLLGELGEESTMDLLMAISFYNGVVRLLNSIDIDLEPEYRSYLADFPFK